jgi:hypothetical protein
MRIAANILAQRAEDLLVIVDDSTGEEVSMDAETADRLVVAIGYLFHDITPVVPSVGLSRDVKNPSERVGVGSPTVDAPVSPLGGVQPDDDWRTFYAEDDWSPGSYDVPR